MLRFRHLILAVAPVLALTDGYAADSTVELSKLLPENANTISVVRVAQILESPRAKSENWAESANDLFLAGASRIPPWVDTLVIGSLVRPGLHQEVWSAAVLELPPTVTMERIARREESRVERLSGLRSVRGQRDAYLVEVRPRTLGVRSPAVRQEAARWARSAADGKTGSLSEYLQAALKKTAHISLAVDLTDASDIQGVRRYLEEHKLVQADAVARVELPQLLVSLRGVSFHATIGESTSAAVVLDFGDAISGSGDAVAGIFRHVMGDMHMSLEEFDSARVVEQAKSVTLSMKLSDESLRHVLSLVTMPQPSHQANDETVSTEPISPRAEVSRVAPELAESQRYYRAVSQVIDDIDRINRKGNSNSRSATWLDNFARKIDHLPSVGVEQELLGFGQRVGERVRALAASLRGQSIQIDAEQQTLVYDVDYRPGWVSGSYWGVVGYGESSYKVTSNLQQVRERQADAVKQGSAQRISIWNMITSDRADVEKIMRERHGDAFFQRVR